MGFYFTSKHFQFFFTSAKALDEGQQKLRALIRFLQDTLLRGRCVDFVELPGPSFDRFCWSKNQKNGIPTLFPGKNYLRTKDINFTIRCASKPVPNRSRFCLGITPYLAPFGKHWLEMMLIQTINRPFSTRVLSPFWSQGCKKKLAMIHAEFIVI